MRTIYLAGPMANCTQEEMSGWRNRVERELAGLYKFRNPVVRQHVPFDAIVIGDKLDIVESDIVLANYWKTGTGTAMEIMFTHMVDRRRLVLTVVPEMKEVSPWIHMHSDHIFNSLDLAIDFLKRDA